MSLLLTGSLQKPQASAYTETLVTAPSGAYLDAPGGAPAGTSSLLFFASIITDAANTARSKICSWDASFGGVWANYVGGGVRVSVVSGNGATGDSGDVVAEGTRYHMLVSAWSSGAAGTLTLRASYRSAGGSWGDAFTDQTATADNATIDDIVAQAQRLFQRRGGGVDWYGQVARIAMWTATDNAEIADPGSATVQDNFVVSASDTIRDPSVARTAYGTPLYDFSGAASTYNAGTHDGSLGTFTVNGTFS